MDYSRNYLFISDDVQKKLANLKILVAGAGIGSAFAALALRTGIRNFIIADGDNVDETNLNRQDYVDCEVGGNKAEACARRLRGIDPQVNVQCVPRFLERKDLQALVPEVDIVTNTIDFDSPAFLDCHEIVKSHGKIELFPINVGFGGCVSVHDADSPTFSEYFMLEQHDEIKQEIITHLIGSGNLERYLVEAGIRYQSGERPSFDPQTGVSVQIASALMVGLIIRLLNGEDVERFPATHYVDAIGGKMV